MIFTELHTKVQSLTDSSKHVNQTPFKYNGGQNYKTPKKGVKYLLNLDWFEFTLRGQFLSLDENGNPPNVLVYHNGDIHLERDPNRWNGTKHYNYVYFVFVDGEQVGTLLTGPRNTAVLDESLSQFRFDNHVLYRKGYVALFDTIVSAIGLQINNPTQIHIAVDGFGFIDQFKDAYDGVLDKIGKAKVAIYACNKMREISGFDIGSRASSKWLTCYQKGRLIEKEQKPYILRAWSDSGLVKDGNRAEVERMEVKLKSAFIKEIENFDYKRLEDSAYLAGIMKKALHKFYEFRRPSEEKNVSRMERIQAIDWDYFKAAKVEKLKKTERPPNVIWRLKQRVAFDMLEYFAKVDKTASNLFEQAYTDNRQLCQKYGVLDWFDRKLKYWKGLREYQLAILDERQKAGVRNRVYMMSASF